MEESFVNELIQFSSKLSEINATKSQLQSLLKELVIFQNFTKIWTSSEKKRSELFQITAQAIPFHAESTFSSENIILTIVNTSPFEFNTLYWQFSIEFQSDSYSNTKATTWRFSNPTSFKIGDSQQFSYPLDPSQIQGDCPPITLKPSLIFSTHWDDSNFLRSFQLNSIPIDILYFLSPARFNLPSVSSTPLFPSLELPFDKADLKDLTPHPGFHLVLNPSFLTSFPAFLLKDSTSRFPPELRSDQIPTLSKESPEFTFYYYSERIKVIRKSENQIIIRCESPNLLSNLKIAILGRLLMREGSRLMINPPDESHCEKLHELRMELSMLLDRRDPSATIYDYMELYLMMRNCSENIQFVLT